jgi:hypothetical protein
MRRASRSVRRDDAVRVARATRARHSKRRKKTGSVFIAGGRHAFLAAPAGKVMF